MGFYRERCVLFPFFFLSIFFSSLGFAATTPGNTTGSFTVSANVINSCELTTTANIEFGDYDPFATADTHAKGGVNLRCTHGTPYYIGLDTGMNAAGGNARKMSDRSSNFLTYELYKEAALTNVWGGADTNRVSSEGNGTVQEHSVYAKIPLGQSVPPGSYNDTIHVTIEY